jgi:hypothetical protein
MGAVHQCINGAAHAETSPQKFSSSGRGRCRAAERVAARPVLIVVPTTPGAANDTIARLMSQWLSTSRAPFRRTCNGCSITQEMPAEP